MGSCMIYKPKSIDCVHDKTKSVEIDNKIGDEINRSSNPLPGFEATNSGGERRIMYDEEGENMYRDKWEEKKSKKGFYSSLDSCPTDSVSLIEIPILDIKFLSSVKVPQFSENAAVNIPAKEAPKESVKKKNKPNLRLFTNEADVNANLKNKANLIKPENTQATNAPQIVAAQAATNRFRKSETIRDPDSPERGFQRKDSTTTDKAPKGILKSPSIKKQKTLGRMTSESFNNPLHNPEVYSPKSVSFKKKVMVKKYKTNSAIRKSLRKVDNDDSDYQDNNNSNYDNNNEGFNQHGNLMRQRKSNQI